MESAEKRKKYRRYLENEDVPVPRTTVYRKKIDQVIISPDVNELYASMHTAVQAAQACIDSEEVRDDFAGGDDFDYDDELVGGGDRVIIDDLLEDDADDTHGDILEEDLSFEEEIIDSICNNSSLSFHEFAVLIMTLKSTFNLSSTTVAFMLKIMKLAMPKDNQIPSLSKLYDYFQGNEALFSKHNFCGRCDNYMGTDASECNKCNNKKVQFFVEIPLKEELKRILQNNWSKLSYRFERDSDDGAVEDVYDGEEYKKLFHENGFLQDRNNFSLLGNTDGVAIFKSSCFSVWPIYMVINELPPNIRFRRGNRILCGLWFGKEKPMFTTFFKPFVENLWSLYTDGVSVTVNDEDGERSETCRGLLLHMTCDSPAKCMFQDFIQFNGYYGCPFCLHPGESCIHDSGGRSHVYPYRLDEENGFGEERTHHQTEELAATARSNLASGKKKYAEKGVKGLTWALSLPHFDIIHGMCLDYMHAVLLGVTKQLMNLWFSKDHKSKEFSVFNQSRTVREKLLDVKPPNNITRAPRSIEDLNHWKASEFRSFLLFYGPACLYGILEEPYYDHFMLLSNSIWMLLKESISYKELDEVSRHLRYFVFQMSSLYGERHLTFSVHLLLHLKTDVLKNGPLWTHSCFPFEDYNGELRHYFHSSQHPEHQVARAVSIVQRLPMFSANIDSDSPASELLKTMTSDRYKAKSLFEVETDIFLVGKGEEVKASIHDFNGEIHLRHPFNDGKFVRYQRALVRGQMIHSKSYQKVTQRNSYTVLYNNDGEDQFGEVLCFGFIEDFYTKNSHNYAFVLPFHEININIVNDNTTGKVTEGLHIFRKERRQQMKLIPTCKVRTKIVLMEMKNSEYIFGRFFPNSYEKD